VSGHPLEPHSRSNCELRHVAAITTVASEPSFGRNCPINCISRLGGFIT